MTDTKKHIAKAVRHGIASRGLSARKLAEMLDMHHPQISRVTNEKNYNIDTLLKLLDALGLEIEIKNKGK